MTLDGRCVRRDFHGSVVSRTPPAFYGVYEDGLRADCKSVVVMAHKVRFLDTPFVVFQPRKIVSCNDENPSRRGKSGVMER